MKWTLKSIALLAILVVLPILDAERINTQIVIVAGTPVRVSATKYLVNRLMIQSRAANTGLIYVMMGVKSTVTCDATNTTQLSAELGPGTPALHPGQTLSDPQGANGNSPADAEDLNQLCLDGTASGDKVLLTFWHRL